MIPRETIKKVIVEYQQFLETVELQERAYAFEPKGKYVMVGIRHAGKSYLLYQRARQLMAAGHVVEEFCYVNFDDERLIGMKAEDLDGILSAYRSLFDRTPILFFDEIQNVAGWEHFARRLANEKYLVFITGSNAKMLSREIATTLGERYLTMEVMPYSSTSCAASPDLHPPSKRKEAHSCLWISSMESISMPPPSHRRRHRGSPQALRSPALRPRLRRTPKSPKECRRYRS